MFTHWSSLESTDCIQAYGTSKPETHIGIRPDGGSHIEVQARGWVTVVQIPRALG